MAGSPNHNQYEFRYRNDDGNESGASWIYTLNNNGSLLTDTNYRMRFTIYNDGTAVRRNLEPRFQYRWYTGFWGAWTNITTSSSVVKAVPSLETSWTITDGDDCSQQLSTGTYDPTNKGYTEDGLSGGATLDMSAGAKAETELCFQIVDSIVSDGNLIQIRLVQGDAGDAVFESYTETPEITVSKPASPVTVPINVLTLSSAPINLTVVPGAVSTLVDVLALASAPIDLTADAPILPVTIPVDVLALASAPIDLSVIPGAVAAV